MSLCSANVLSLTIFAVIAVIILLLIYMHKTQHKMNKKTYLITASGVASCMFLVNYLTPACESMFTQCIETIAPFSGFIIFAAKTTQ